MNKDANSYHEVLKVKRAYEDELLIRKNVVGCGVGLKEVNNKETSDLSIVVYVTLKTSDVPEEDMIPKQLDGIPTDVQESFTSPEYPVSIASYYNPPKHCSVYGGICRLECMEEQKLETVRHGLRNKVDLAFCIYVTPENIEAAAKETGLFLNEYKQQKEEDLALGEYYKGPGGSTGRYRKSIDSIFSGAGQFMKVLKQKTLEGTRKHQKARKKSGFEPIFPWTIPPIGEIRKVGTPKVGMKVFKIGAGSGMTEGKIKALDASLFIDYPPHLGVGMDSTPDFGEPLFSPSPLRGGRFPRDIIGIFSSCVPIKFWTKIRSCPWAGKKPGFPKPPYRRALFEEQIVTDAKSKKEDSGAPLINENKGLIGIHFAGSDRFSFFNTIQNSIEAKDLVSS